MARTLHDARLDTRNARLRLKQRREPYWRSISGGLAVGYRRGSNGGTWIARHYSPEQGRRYHSIGTADDVADADGVHVLAFNQAQEPARAWFAQLAHDDGGTKRSGPYLVRDALADYFAFLRHEGRAEDAVRDAEGRAAALIEPKLGELAVGALTAKQLRGWRDGLVKTGARLRTRPGEVQKYRAASNDEDATRARRSSANRTWTVLRAALNHAFAEGKAANDREWRKVKPFKGVDGVRPDWLTVEQAKRLINASEPDFRLLVQGALLTGGRYGSLTRLKVRDFDQRSGSVMLKTRKGDGSEKRFNAVLTDEGARFFRQITIGRSSDELVFVKANGSPWQKSEQARRMSVVCKRAKIKPAVGFNALRHSWASLAIANGTSLMVVAENLGHTSTRMAEKHYGHLAPSYVADEIRKGAPTFGLKTDGKIAPLLAGRA